MSFISGSLCAILVVMTLFEEEMQQGFEITPNRSAFFYIGLLGTILAISSSICPEIPQVPDPEGWMKQVALDTHYMPQEWRGYAHTLGVRF